MAKDISKIDLFDRNGSLVFSTSDPIFDKTKLSQTIDKIEADPVARQLLKNLCGIQERQSAKVTRGAVLKEAENLGFVSKDGAIKGFLNILPRATILNACMESFNQKHLSFLNATRIDFPYVFDNSQADMETLTQSYEKQSRMFSLGGEDSSYRLSYAADPGLFSWLRGKTLRNDKLPYTVYTPLEILRRFKIGEIAGLDTLRQYHVPDLHIFDLESKAYDTYINNFKLSADDSRVLFNECFACFHEIAEDLSGTMSNLGKDTSKLLNKSSVIFWKKTRDRYYGIKSGIQINAGFAPIRLFTMQYDDTNASLFNIHSESAEKIIIIHATLAGGWPKILPIILGTALSELEGRYIPSYLSSHHITCLPFQHIHEAHALKMTESLSQQGIRLKIDRHYNLSIGDRIKKLKTDWREFIMVIGDRELQGAEPLITRLPDGTRIPLTIFLKENIDRFKSFVPATGLLNDLIPYKICSLPLQ